MASELQLSNTQVAAGPLVLDGETLTGIVVTTGYVFSSSHNLAAVTPYEVTPASEESRLAATAATILDEAETGWYVTVAGSTALDLSDVANRGGIAWFRPNNDYIGFSEDIGGTNAAYLPTWPDGLFFDRIGSYDDLIGRTVAGVAFDVSGNVPTDDLAAALAAASGSGGGAAVTVFGVFVVSAVDGTATSFSLLYAHQGATAGGGVPDGFLVQGVVSTEDLLGFLAEAGYAEDDSVLIAVVEGPHAGVWSFTPATINQAWTAVPVSLAACTLSTRWLGMWTGDRFTTVDGRSVAVDATLVPFRGAAGLLANSPHVDSALVSVETILDSHRIVRGYFLDPQMGTWPAPVDGVVDLSGIVTDDGQAVHYGDFLATLGDHDPVTGANWIGYVHPETGELSFNFETPIPSGSQLWPGTVSTNSAIGGETFTATSGAAGEFRPYWPGLVNLDGDPYLTGQPGRPFAETPNRAGEWLITPPPATPPVVKAIVE